MPLPPLDAVVALLAPACCALRKASGLPYELQPELALGLRPDAIVRLPLSSFAAAGRPGGGRGGDGDGDGDGDAATAPLSRQRTLVLDAKARARGRALRARSRLARAGFTTAAVASTCGLELGGGGGPLHAFFSEVC